MADSFIANDATETARAGDLLVVAMLHRMELFVAFAAEHSTIAKQIAALFGIAGHVGNEFRYQGCADGNGRKLDFAATRVMERLGLVPVIEI